MNFLLDTNVWLERLLDQDKSEEVNQLLNMVPSESIFMSDFTLHSIGIILFRLKKPKIFQDLVVDLFAHGNVGILNLNPDDQIDLISISQKNKLDFDDSYQYLTSVKYDLSLVTFDKDFKKSKIKVLSPIQAIHAYQNHLS